jgi:hypothetical protein
MPPHQHSSIKPPETCFLLPSLPVVACQISFRNQNVLSNLVHNVATAHQAIAAKPPRQDAILQPDHI